SGVRSQASVPTQLKTNSLVGSASVPRDSASSWQYTNCALPSAAKTLPVTLSTRLSIRPRFRRSRIVWLSSVPDWDGTRFSEIDQRAPPTSLLTRNCEASGGSVAPRAGPCAGAAGADEVVVAV